MPTKIQIWRHVDSRTRITAEVDTLFSQRVRLRCGSFSEGGQSARRGYEKTNSVVMSLTMDGSLETKVVCV